MKARKPYQLWKRKIKKGQVYYYRLPGQKWKTTGRTSRAKAENFILEELKKDTPESSELTLKEYAEPFFVWDKCPRCTRLYGEGKQIGKDHAKHQRSLLKRFILQDPISEKQIGEIRRADVLDFRKRLRLNRSARGANAVITALSAILSEAEFREDITRRNPCSKVGNLKYEIKESGTFTEEELARFFPDPDTEDLGPWTDRLDYTIFLTAATIGMRRGELIALKWKNVNFEKKCIEVCEALKHDGSIGKPKWNKIRQPPLPDITAKALKKRRESTEWVLPEHFVFCHKTGDRIGSQRWKLAFRRAMIKAKIDVKTRNLTPHSFRHSLNSILRKKGYSDELTRAALGWTNASTQDAYTHFKPEDMQGQARLIDGIFP
jgi:integrase